MRHAGAVDRPTVEGFGYEWTKFDQSRADPAELERLFAEYFALFPWDALPPTAVGLDLGCGSGRWARLVASRTGTVVAVDASAEALAVASMNAPGSPLVRAAAGALPFASESMDFGYSLGVLHHIPNTPAGLADAVATLKPGAPFLVYLYYAFDNRPAWFRRLWRVSDAVRLGVSRAPAPLRYGISQLVAMLVYLPLARAARLFENLGYDVASLPLSAYRDRSLYVMRTDALDRFGTRLERRFTRDELVVLLEQSGLVQVRVLPTAPYWCAIGLKGSTGSTR
jgi:SAM-dependent methyltransferase